MNRMNEQSSSLIKILQNNFKLTSFRPGQLEIIKSVLEKKDTLAVLPTGAGKSLCYQLPTAYTQQLVIVVSPLIALMKDQVSGLQNYGIRAACLYSGQSRFEKIEIFNQLNQPGAFVLYLSPERIQKPGFQQWIQNRPLALFAIDEAHCVSQWGHDFREEYAELKILKKLRPDVPILALTASATPTVSKDIIKNLNLNSPNRFVRGFYRNNLYYQVETCLDESLKIRWIQQSLNQTPEGRVIIYCGTRRTTEELAKILSEEFENIGYYHAGLSTETRSQIQNDFAKEKIRILVATNAFGMGIDQPNVRLVVHYQMPANIDSLYQEMGRAGRDGNESTCLMLYSKKDKGLQSYFIQESSAPTNIKNARWHNLEALISYAEGSECRHAEVLTYFKDSQRIVKCGHCDICSPKSIRKILTPMIYQKMSTKNTKSVKLKSAKKSNLAQELDPIQEQGFQNLRRWRKQRAIELDKPAFILMSDKTLRQIAFENPQNLEQLKKINGIGPDKLEKFGWDILAVINK